MRMRPYVTLVRTLPVLLTLLNTSYSTGVQKSWQLTNLIHKFFFYNKFIICLYMFRVLCAQRQEAKIALYSIWYHHASRWPSGALSQPVHRTAT